jgi:hypothetical protein
MANFKTRFPDIQEQKLAFGLTLFDRFTRASQLVGKTTVRLADMPPVPPFLPFQKSPEAIFLFSGLAPGNYRVEVRSNEADQGSNDPPYYAPVDIAVTLPMPHPRWPAFPDALLADQRKPLDDPTQIAAYRQQRALATLQPTTAYPFPEDAILVRGRVLAGGLPLAQATVEVDGGDLNYATGADGEYVLFFTRMTGVTQTVTLRAVHALHAPVTRTVGLQRGMTVAANIEMSP